ncbi:TraM recognition domain-containing protein (plasmid) [Enterocloster clostridioformis]
MISLKPLKGNLKEIKNSDIWKYKKFPILVGALLSITGINLFIIFIRGCSAIHLLSSHGLPKSFFYVLLSLLSPVILFVWSTAFDVYNYWIRKKAIIYYIILNSIIIFTCQIMRLTIPLVVPLTLQIPISNEVTVSMVVSLTRFIIIIFSCTPSVGTFLMLRNIVGEKYNMDAILNYKVKKYLDLRKEKKFKYDFSVVTNLATGKVYTVKEKDRTLHGFADGTTGTAKTSSVLSQAICDDLDQKVFNENYQRRACYDYLLQGEFKVNRYFTDKSFSINYIQPVIKNNSHQNKKLKKIYNDLKFVSQTIGLNCIAPNAAFADEVYEMASSRGFPVNRIDPILTNDNQQKTDFIGFNPLYISPTLNGVARDVDITNKATIFADVLQCLYEASGSGDAYFISLNNSVTIAICKLLMLTFSVLHKRQPNPGDVQLCINDFSLCEPYLKVLTDQFGDNGNPMNAQQREIAEDRVRYDIQTQQRNINCGLWQDVYTLIKNDLLGPNRDNMFDRANGLRLQINNFLNHPLIRRVLCCDRTIDLDKALANGEITVVNYVLELGKSVSTAFGLFYLLSLSKAVLRRPGKEDSRTLHMVYIDELSFLLHPALEEFFTIFRQYRVGNFVAFQTLDQMDKSQTTKYLRGVLLGNCAHQIVFGRVSPSEMQIYESMGGKVNKPVEQTSISETSMTAENPSYSYSTRQTEQLGNLIEGHEIRNRDFQEVTFFTVNDNSPVPPFAGKVHFLDSKKRKGHPICHFDWERFMSDVAPTGDTGFPPSGLKVQAVATVIHNTEYTKKNPRFSSCGILCHAQANCENDDHSNRNSETSPPDSIKHLDSLCTVHKSL